MAIKTFVYEEEYSYDEVIKDIEKFIKDKNVKTTKQTEMLTPRGVRLTVTIVYKYKKMAIC